MSPKRSRNLCHAALPLALFVLPLCMPLCLRSHVKPGAGREAPYGRYTQRQIIAHSRTLCRALAPERTDLRLEVERHKAPATEESSGRLWNVYASGAAGEHVLYLQFDADTGAVQIVGRDARTLPESDSAPLTRQGAVRAGRAWLRLLGAMPAFPDGNEGACGPAWRLVAVTAPRPGCRRWTRVWQAGGETVLLFLDPGAGRVLLAKRKYDPALKPV